MPSTSVTRPPIPQAPLVDPQTGYVTREWWRWFASIGTASLATTSSITNINNDITNIIEEAQPIPLLDDPSDADEVMRQAMLLRTPGECSCDLGDAAKMALRFIPPTEAIGPQLDDLLRKVLEILRPVDQVAADQLAQALQRPADPASDQLALLAQILGMPNSPLPSGSRGQVLTSLGSAWVGSNVINANASQVIPPGFLFLPEQLLNLFQVDGKSLDLTLNAFGTGVRPSLDMGLARGTMAAPTAVQTNDALFNFTGNGYGTTALVGPGFRQRAIAAENWSDTNQGAKLEFALVPVGSGWPTATICLMLDPINGNSLLGTPTNNNAGAGYVGEFVSSVIGFPSRLALTDGVFLNVTSISLTPGDWDVNGNLEFVFSVAGTGAEGEVTTTSLGSNDNTENVAYAYFDMPAGGFTGQTFISFAVGTARISVGSTTTVYLTAAGHFGAGTGAAYGTIRARRMR